MTGWRSALRVGAANALSVGLVSLSVSAISKDQLIRAVVIQAALSASWGSSIKGVALGGRAEMMGFVVGGSLGVGLGMLIARAF